MSSSGSAESATSARGAAGEKVAGAEAGQVGETDVASAPEVMRSVVFDVDRAEEALVLRAFGQSVKELCGAAGLTQRQLESRCYLREERVSLIERGLREPTLRMLLLLAEGLGVSMDALTGRLPVPNREAGRGEILALIAKDHPISSKALVDASGLSSIYVRRIIRYLEAFELIDSGRDGWFPGPRRATLGKR
jgi:transcriptional regulator with XRE-family HTH domain